MQKNLISVEIYNHNPDDGRCRGVRDMLDDPAHTFKLYE